jgi:predicted AlkP superfamily pyrophosphatase or phosphodiesterase
MAKIVTRFRNAVLPGLAALVFGGFLPSHAVAVERVSLTVIVVSLDGTRPDDVVAAPMPTLASLAARGALAERLTPVFPTNTFPNHVSLVTGVSPALHGIVNNVFLDAERGLFRYSNDPSWLQAEPLWSIAERHGVPAASYHWIGSEGPWRNGHGPRHWRAFSSDTPEVEKVEQILRWLDLEEADERPRLVTSWFRGADRAAHRFGPGSREVHRALRKQDRALARLVTGLEERGAFDSTIVLVVSDHGMAGVSRLVDLRGSLRALRIDARVFGAGGFATLSVPGGAADVERIALRARKLGLDPVRPGTGDSRFATANPRFGDLVVLAPIGTALSGHGGAPMRGAHGYSPAEPSMGALLIAAGGGIPPGTRLGDVRNIDVAPTVLTWLGIEVPAAMEGKPIVGLVLPSGERAAESVGETR